MLYPAQSTPMQTSAKTNDHDLVIIDAFICARQMSADSVLAVGCTKVDELVGEKVAWYSIVEASESSVTAMRR